MAPAPALGDVAMQEAEACLASCVTRSSHCSPHPTSGSRIKWVRVARGILAADANEIKIEARSHAIVRRVLKRLSLEFGRTGALRWIENHLAYQDPSLYFMRDERALYAYAQPIALRWEQRPELR